MNHAYSPRVRFERIPVFVSPVTDERFLARLADAIVAALVARGWAPAQPGNRYDRACMRGEWWFDVDAKLAALRSGAMSYDEWRHGAQVAQIADIDVPLPSAEPMATAPPVAPELPVAASATGFVNPVATTGFVNPVPTRTERRGTSPAVIALFALLLCAFGYFGYHALNTAKQVHATDKRVKAANQEATYQSIGTAVVTDGHSSLPGGALSLTYTPGPHDHESIYDGNDGGGPHDSAWWRITELGKDGQNAGLFEFQYFIWKPPMVPGADEQRFLSRMDAVNSGYAGESVKRQRTRVGGRSAYVWQYTDTEGHWWRDYWVLYPVNSFAITCSAQTVAGARHIAKRCDELMSKVKFHVPAK